jgi:hypothetical protein
MEVCRGVEQIILKFDFELEFSSIRGNEYPSDLNQFCAGILPLDGALRQFLHEQ